MAQATVKYKEIPIDKVILELTPEEAFAVFIIMGKCTGSTSDSPRKYTDNVWDALSNVFKNCGSENEYLFVRDIYISFSEKLNTFNELLQANTIKGAAK